MSLLREFMGAALAMMRRHEDAWPFRDPVSRAEVPDYYDIIRVGCARHTCHTPPPPAPAVRTQPALQRMWSRSCAASRVAQHGAGVRFHGRAAYPEHTCSVWHSS
jgi:hypothetical protein